MAPYPGMLGHFEDARAIRDAFFAGGAAQPSLRFGVIIASVDAETTQFALEIDGQKFDDRKGGAAPGTWPGQNAGSASASFNDRTGIASGPAVRGALGAVPVHRCRPAASRQRHPDDADVPGAARTRGTGGDRRRQPGQPIRQARMAAIRLRLVNQVDVGFYGKLPTHGDFLRRRTSDAFVAGWDAWLQAGMTASQAALGERWLDVYLTSPAWRFVCAAGACGPAPVAGVLVPSIDRVGRYFPLTVVAQLSPDIPIVTVATQAPAFFTAAEQLLVDTLAVEDVNFERFDARVADLRAELAHLGGAATEVVLQPAAASLLLGGANWQLPIESTGDLWTVFGQLLSRQMEGAYQPLVMWWTEGSAMVDPSCLIGAGLPSPPTFGAFLDGTWAKHRWRAVPAHVTRPEPSAEESLLDRATVRMRSAAATDVGRVRTMNQDAFVERPELGLWVVADGLGGHRDGEIASREVCDALADLPPALGSRSPGGRRPGAHQAGERPSVSRLGAVHPHRPLRQHGRRAARARDRAARCCGPATAASTGGGRVSWIGSRPITASAKPTR